MEFLLTYILPFLILFSIVVFVHELGHFLAARFCGVQVEAFSIGVGRKILSWTDKKGTCWKLSLLPLGGYVRMFGDEDMTSAREEEGRVFTDEEKEISFHHKPVSKRSFIVFSGPFFNFLFAILVFTMAFATVGKQEMPPVIGTVMEDSVAEAGGFKEGDRVLSIDGAAVTAFYDIQQAVARSHGAALVFDLERADGSKETLTVSPRVEKKKDNFGSEYEMAFLGVGSMPAAADGSDVVRLPIHMAFIEACKTTRDISINNLVALGQIIAGRRSTNELGGPLRIAELSGEAAQSGLLGYFSFMASLSIVLGLINLFPIPLLDGGHLLFYGIEAVLRRPLNEQAQEIGFRIGLGLLLALMLYATWNDVLRIFNRVVS